MLGERALPLLLSDAAVALMVVVVLEINCPGRCETTAACQCVSFIQLEMRQSAVASVVSSINAHKVWVLQSSVHTVPLHRIDDKDPLTTSGNGLTRTMRRLPTVRAA